jgi:hypothetical protein
MAPLTAVVVSKSTDGGFTWADPIVAAGKDLFTHFLDKDWSAVDPTNPRNLYVTYTDFDFSFSSCGSPRLAIELVRSSDGGMTWSAPTVVTEHCSQPPDFSSVQDSQVVVDSQGNVFVEWELFSQSPSGETRELRIAKSTNHGASFYPSVKISDVTATGDGFALQGLFRTGITGNLAVDRSGTKTDGDLYITWEDGRFLLYPDLESPFGRYGYANILISRSRDGGKTWSPPVRVNDDPVHGEFQK